ncbi:MAG TPA: hypothetical protein VFT34_17940 [Verrucomicrobiae bacterium]|nr:hypothetical protein [Verrucomicrobiae bacterium]
MWNRPSNWKLILASILLAPIASGLAADDDMGSSTNKNRLTVRGRLGLNIQAKFSRIGTFPAATDIGGTGSALDHFYDDGYVRVDESGNYGGQTWYWGYDSASQISGNNLLFHSSSASVGASHEVSDDPQYGVEMVYNRDIGAIGSKCRWGLEMAFGWNGIELRDSRPLRGDVTRVTDAYAFTPGTTPPAAPFDGPFSGPSFTISDTPNRSIATIPGGAAITGVRDLRADLFAGRIGPYFEFPLSSKVQLTLSGGLAVGVLYSEFAFRERIDFGTASVVRSGSRTDGDALYGGFAGANLNYKFEDRWKASIGAQFESLGARSHSVSGHNAELDLSKSVYLSFGLGYSF